MTIRYGVFVFMLAVAMPAAAQSPSSTAIEPSITAPRPGQAPELTPEQKSMIFRSVRQDRTKVAKLAFPAQVGAEVPPSLELYLLPDDALIEVPVTKVYRVVVTEGKVVLVDPTTMRVVDVIDR
jgi:hypothetical protein